jgi:hypothetical protein
LDAAVAPWTAMRLCKGEARQVCEAECDEKGLWVSILVLVPPIRLSCHAKYSSGDELRSSDGQSASEICPCKLLGLRVMMLNLLGNELRKRSFVDVNVIRTHDQNFRAGQLMRSRRSHCV